MFKKAGLAEKYERKITLKLSLATECTICFTWVLVFTRKYEQYMGVVAFVFCKGYNYTCSLRRGKN